MAKRFTDTGKWQDLWFQELPCHYKLLWLYVLDNCDHAGIWKVNMRLASYHVGKEISEVEALEIFAGRIQNFKDGYWYLTKFVKFQYGGFKNDAVGKSVQKILITNNLHGATEGLARGYQAPKDKAKDKDKVRVKAKEGVIGGGFYKPEDFDLLPDQYFRTTIEQMKIQKNMNISREQVGQMWFIFRHQQLAGDKYYNSKSDVYRHFSNWIKNQKFEQNGKPTKTQQRDQIVQQWIIDNITSDGIPPDLGF